MVSLHKLVLSAWEAKTALRQLFSRHTMASTATFCWVVTQNCATTCWTQHIHTTASLPVSEGLK